jgi:ElaB/YqjD/DUF883 family membrane-anchored ribosome-binding protein
MLNEQELIQQQMEKTRGSLTEKLEALEGQVSETVASTAGAVQDTTQSVQETVTGAVDAVKDTVASVTDKVEETITSVTDKFQETVQSVTDSFNLRVQMERHPWLVLGGAVAVGCLVGSSFGGPRESPAVTPTPSVPPPAPPPWSQVAPQSVASPQTENEDGGIWDTAVSHLKDIGVSYLMGLVRDLAKRGLPEVVGHRIADEVDALTTKMGTEPIAGSVLPETDNDQSQNESDAGTRIDNRDKKGSTYRGRSPVEATAI